MTFTSFSQVETKQDVFVAAHFAHKRCGYFVDVGAYDGKYLSNTYQLEKVLGWTGICIEPLDHAFGGLKANRSCICVQAAAYSIRDLEMPFSKSDVLSGLTGHIDRHQEALSGPRVHVKTETLAALLSTHNAPREIDYLSIDTEGSEMHVLLGMDWERYKVGYITLEHNFMEPRRAEMRGFLAAHGYRHLRENHFDDDYVRA